MSGRFEGLTDAQWELLSLFFPEQKRTVSKSIENNRSKLHLLYSHHPFMIIRECRWCDRPEGEQWGARSTSHRWLEIWKQDGTFERIKQGFLSIGQLNEQIDWESSSVDGSFSPR